MENVKRSSLEEWRAILGVRSTYRIQLRQRQGPKRPIRETIRIKFLVPSTIGQNGHRHASTFSKCYIDIFSIESHRRLLVDLLFIVLVIVVVVVVQQKALLAHEVVRLSK